MDLKWMFQLKPFQFRNCQVFSPAFILNEMFCRMTPAKLTKLNSVMLFQCSKKLTSVTSSLKPSIPHKGTCLLQMVLHSNIAVAPPHILKMVRPCLMNAVDSLAFVVKATKAHLPLYPSQPYKEILTRFSTNGTKILGSLSILIVPVKASCGGDHELHK